MEETNLSSVLMIACIIISIIIAIIAGNSFEDKHPDLLPYKWGFFQGWAGVLGGATFAFIVLFNPLLLFNDPRIIEDEGFRTFMTTFMFIYSAVMAVACLFIIKRRKWGWIVATIFSFNPILWIINGIYIKNRWKELGENNL